MQVSILHLIDDLDLGGAGRVMATLVNSLSKDKYRTIVCSLEDGPVSRELKQSGIGVITLPKKRPYDLIFLWKLIHLIQHERVRLIHSHLLISSIYGWIAAKVARIPLVITLHGKSLFNLKRGNTLFPYIARHCSKVICVSDSLRKETEGRRLPPRNLLTIHNGIDMKKFNNLAGTDGLRRDLGLNSSSPVVGSVGVLRAVKRYDCLLESVPLVLNEFPAAKFILVGDGPLKNDLKKKADALNISSSVIFLGQRDDIPHLLSIFDVFVLSSATEGVSIAILEAMACSKAVVATDVGGNSGVVQHGKTGLLVSPQNSEALSEAIIKLLENEEIREQMGKAGRKRAEEEFSLEDFVCKHEKLYDSLLSKKQLK